MARTYTTNLKLILDDTLTSDSRYNLERLDSLGDTFIILENQKLEIRNSSSIVLRPNSAESGGTGSGGYLDMGTSSQSLQLITMYADLISTLAPLEIGNKLSLQDSGFKLDLQSPTLTDDQTFVLPGSDGSSGQVLSTDGAGNLGFVDGAGGQSATYTWIPANGVTKTISHNFNSPDIQVTVYDLTGQNVMPINKIEFISDDVVQLTSLAAPDSGGYKVFLKEN